jgi:hypothetical protein
MIYVEFGRINVGPITGGALELESKGPWPIIGTRAPTETLVKVNTRNGPIILEEPLEKEGVHPDSKLKPSNHLER